MLCYYSYQAMTTIPESFTQRLLEINKRMVGERDPQRLLEFIMDTAIELSKVEAGLLLILDETGEFKPQVARNIQKENLETIQFSRTVAREVLRTGEPVLSLDAPKDENLKSSESILTLKLKTIACVPLKIQNKTIGVIYLDTTQRMAAFQKDFLPLLQAFADQAAVALQNAWLFQENENYRRRLESDLSQTKQELEEREESLQELKAQISERPRKTVYGYEQIIGRSKKMEEILKILDKITNAQVPVFILGETGTGKELLARAIHQNSLRREAPFVAINCSAFPETILESELFGYYKGSFTGADRDRKGLFETADGGVLFLDEIADMSLAMQAKVLRTIQEQEVLRLGGRLPIKVNVRVISAANKDLKKMVREAKFREDLYFRIAGITIPLPPLRERKEDIPLLIKHFIGKIAKENNLPQNIHIGREAMNALLAYHWPGNIREMENCLTNAGLLSEGMEIKPEHLIMHHDLYQDSDAAPGPTQTRPPIEDRLAFNPDKKIEDYEREIILKTLKYCSGNKSETARRLGVSRLTLHKKIEEYGLPEEESKGNTR